jgi:hypothetical protein
MTPPTPGMETLVLTEIIRRLYKVIHTGNADPEAMDLAATLLIPALRNRPDSLRELHLYPFDHRVTPRQE